MNLLKIIKDKYSFGVCMALLCSGSVAYAQSQAQMDSLQPTSYVVPPKANLLLTLDDSGSMVGKVDGESTATTAEEVYDPNSYQPDVVYEVPPNLDGTPRTDLDSLSDPHQGFIDPFWGDMGNNIKGNLTRHAGTALTGSDIGLNYENIFTSRINTYWRYSNYANGYYTHPANNRVSFRVPDGWSPSAPPANSIYVPMVPRCPSEDILTDYANDISARIADGEAIDGSLKTIDGQVANCRVW